MAELPKNIVGKWTRCFSCNYKWNVKTKKLPEKCPWCNTQLNKRNMKFTDESTDWQELLG